MGRRNCCSLFFVSLHRNTHSVESFRLNLIAGAVSLLPESCSGASELPLIEHEKGGRKVWEYKVLSRNVCYRNDKWDDCDVIAAWCEQESRNGILQAQSKSYKLYLCTKTVFKEWSNRCSISPQRIHVSLFHTTHYTEYRPRITALSSQQPEDSWNGFQNSLDTWKLWTGFNADTNHSYCFQKMDVWDQIMIQTLWFTSAPTSWYYF